MKNITKLIERYDRAVENHRGMAFYPQELTQIRDRALAKGGGQMDILLEAIYSSLKVGFMAGADYTKRRAAK